MRLNTKKKTQLDATEKQGKNNLEVINKQKKQLKKSIKKELIKRAEKKEKSGRIVLLRDNLDDILVTYDMNITAKGEDILKKLANDERMINCKNLLFKSGNSTINNHDFYKRFGTLYDLLYDLISETKTIKTAVIEQNEMITKINEVRKFVLLEEESINKKRRGAIKKSKTKTQKRKTISSKKSVIKHAIKLYDKRDIIINAFINKNIQLGDLEEDVYLEEKPEYEERTKTRRQNQERQGLKILTPQQMLSRPPISSAQLEAGNNSERLKNEIRKLLYSLYRSIKLSKTINKYLMNAI